MRHLLQYKHIAQVSSFKNKNQCTRTHVDETCNPLRRSRSRSETTVFQFSRSNALAFRIRRDTKQITFFTNSQVVWF